MFEIGSMYDLPEIKWAPIGDNFKCTTIYHLNWITLLICLNISSIQIICQNGILYFDNSHKIVNWTKMKKTFSRKCRKNTNINKENI